MPGTELVGSTCEEVDMLVTVSVVLCCFGTVLSPQSLYLFMKSIGFRKLLEMTCDVVLMVLKVSDWSSLTPSNRFQWYQGKVQLGRFLLPDLPVLCGMHIIYHIDYYHIIINSFKLAVNISWYIHMVYTSKVWLPKSAYPNFATNTYPNLATNSIAESTRKCQGFCNNQVLGYKMQFWRHYLGINS